jgi:general secretion pathway protein B
MSYILEALKKSEQERGRGTVPDIKSVHAYVPPPSVSRRTWWPWALASVVAINGIILAVVYLGDDTSTGSTRISEREPFTATNPVTEPPATDSVQAQSSAPTVTVPDVKKPEQSQQPVVKKDRQPVNKTPNVVVSKTILQADDTVGNITEQDKIDAGQPTRSIKPGKVKKDAAVLPSDLPENVRKQIPSIAFEGHVYSSTVSRRSVMINGKKMRQGDALSGGLILKQITPLGAEFEYQGYLFRLNALQDWSYR